MDPTKLLEADHRQVEALFDQIQQAEGEQRAALVEELTTAVRGHMELEEDVVYPAMEGVVGQEMVQEGHTEHELARKVLEDVVRLCPDQPGFQAALDAAKAGIEHHVEDEEGKVFPQLRRDGQDVLASMTSPFVAKRQQLGLPMDAESLAAAMTKEELVEEAKAAEVSGAASMTKTELAEALVDRMTTG